MIFIGGAPRTGKNLIQKHFFAENKQLFPETPECYYLSFLMEAYATGKEIWDKTTFSDLFENFDSYSNLNRDIIDNYFNFVHSKYGHNLTLVQHYAYLTTYFPELYELYPKAKFIIMKRNLYDNIYEMQQTKVLVNNKVQDNFDQYLECYSRVCEFHKKNHLENFLFLDYEDLIFNPDKITNKLTSFLDTEINFNGNLHTNKIGIGKNLRKEELLYLKNLEKTLLDMFSTEE